jgi:hypothetical protein
VVTVARCSAVEDLRSSPHVAPSPALLPALHPNSRIYTFAALIDLPPSPPPPPKPPHSRPPALTDHCLLAEARATAATPARSLALLAVIIPAAVWARVWVAGERRGESSLQHGGRAGGQPDQGGSGGSWPTSGDAVHVACTSNGSPYLNYQTLALYGTYRLARRQAGGASMVAFTRILHRTAHDALSPYIPTFRADPPHPGGRRRRRRVGGRRGGPERSRTLVWPLALLLVHLSLLVLSTACLSMLLPAAECDGGRTPRRGAPSCRYVVADRPSAVRQFLRAAQRSAGVIQVGGAALLQQPQGQRAAWGRL